MLTTAMSATVWLSLVHGAGGWLQPAGRSRQLFLCVLSTTPFLLLGGGGLEFKGVLLGWFPENPVSINKF